MTALACALLRHDVRPRFIGDLVAGYCHTCGCLWISEEPTTVTSRHDSPQSAGGRVVLPPASPVAGVLQAATTATPARTAG